MTKTTACRRSVLSFAVVGALAIVAGSDAKATAGGIDYWFPEITVNLNPGIVGVSAKFVAHYHLQIDAGKTGRAQLSGWYYIRVNGHKIVDNPNHVPVRFRLENAAGRFESNYPVFKDLNLNTVMEVTPGKVRVRIRFTGKWPMTLLDKTLTYSWR